MKKINETIICAGFGGQGVMVLGKFLANSAMKEGYNVTQLPSYGAEVRGGTARSFVTISSDEIADPVIEKADTAIILNGPSLDKFESSVRKNGLIIVNTSLCMRKVRRKDLQVFEVPLSEIATELGNIKVANIIGAGIYAGVKGFFDRKILVEVIEGMAGKRKKIIPVNVKAIDKGLELACVGKNERRISY